MTGQEAIEILTLTPEMQRKVPHLSGVYEVAVKALEEIQQYRALEKRLADMFGGELSLEYYVDELEKAMTEPDKPHPVNARILTYEDADMWEAYKAIGTPEECRAAVEKQIPKKPINPEEDYGAFVCPNCGGLIFTYERFETYKFCLLCGQAIDWSDK